MNKIIASILVLILLLSTATSCNINKKVSSDDGRDNEYDVNKIENSMVASNSEFAFNIFAKLNEEEKSKSIFISPLSISTALTMTYNGAETTTKQSMERVLQFDNMDRNAVNESFKNLLNYLDDVDKKVDLNIANSIWIRQGEEIKEPFINSNRDNFNAKVAMLDFSKDTAAETINNWISDATNKKIEKMLTPPIASNVVMYLINAIYFKGEWTTQFKAEDTFDKIFNSVDGNKQTVDMMNRKGKVEYAKGDNYKAVRLPYGNGKTSMYCVLPDEAIGIDEFTADFDINRWNEVRGNINEIDDVVLQLPKFKLEYGIKNLNDSLKSLGMEIAFSENADFSGMRNGLFISRVLHKAVIEVNEEGSEAAGVTVVEMVESAAMEPITFIADRPFLFYIVDDTTGTILFMGKLSSV